MNSSAGLAFAPHVIAIGVGEVGYILSHFTDIENWMRTSGSFSVDQVGFICIHNCAKSI